MYVSPTTYEYLYADTTEHTAYTVRIVLMAYWMSDILLRTDRERVTGGGETFDGFGVSLSVQIYC
jgi:hypothetical protein